MALKITFEIISTVLIGLNLFFTLLKNDYRDSFDLITAVFSTLWRAFIIVTLWVV